MELSELQAEIALFAKARDWEKFHTVKNLILALVGEAGELAAVVQWLNTVDVNFLESNPDVKQDLSDELADVFIYLLRIAEVSGIDLMEVTKLKMQKNANRYTVEKSYGNAEKQ